VWCSRGGIGDRFFLYGNGISPLNDVQGGVTELRAEVKKLGVSGLNDVFRG